jgi:hypothetical protein
MQITVRTVTAHCCRMYIRMGPQQQCDCDGKNGRSMKDESRIRMYHVYPITKSRCVSPTSSTGFAFHGNGGCVAVEGTISSWLLLGLLIELSRLPVGDTSSGHCVAIVVDLSKGGVLPTIPRRRRKMGNGEVHTHDKGHAVTKNIRKKNDNSILLDVKYLVSS